MSTASQYPNACFDFRFFDTLNIGRPKLRYKHGKQKKSKEEKAVNKRDENLTEDQAWARSQVC